MKEIGQGAAFTGMMRQLGGSFGIAAITTFISNQNSIHRENIAQHLDANSFDVQQRVAALKASFMAKSFSPDVALQSAYKPLDLNVLKQASVLSYMDVFLYLGAAFLGLYSFRFIRERKKRQGTNRPWRCNALLIK